MPSNEKDSEITAFIDTLPNLIRIGQTKTVENFLRKEFERSLPNKIARYGELSYLFIQIAPFHSILQEARSLYVNGYYRGAVALCDMTVESLCSETAKERVNDNELLRQQLSDPHRNCRKKIECLKKYLKVAKSASLLHRVLDIRKRYLHLHKTQILSEEILECINALHLAVLAEYGLVPADRGKVRFTTEKDVDHLIKKMKLKLT